MAKEIKEWTFDTYICGKLALISKGDPANPPVLLVHGFMDTAATFYPLLEKLPDNYYYVGFDFPGQGKSEPFPPGLPVTHPHLVEVMRLVVDHLNWQHFTFLGHSLAFLIGSFYNLIYPGKIVNMINIDPKVNIVWQYYGLHNYLLYVTYYNRFYKDYDRNSSINPRTFKYSEAVSLLAQGRNLTEEQSRKIISRSLVHVEGDLYRFSSENRMKIMVGLPLTDEVVFHVITAIKVPILNIHATVNLQKTIHSHRALQFGADLYDKIIREWKDVEDVTLQGGHDIHIIDPEGCAEHIKRFLSRKTRKSKL